VLLPYGCSISLRSLSSFFAVRCPSLIKQLSCLCSSRSLFHFGSQQSMHTLHSITPCSCKAITAFFSYAPPASPARRFSVGCFFPDRLFMVKQPPEKPPEAKASVAERSRSQAPALPNHCLGRQFPFVRLAVQALRGRRSRLCDPT
jgi:hypothetical protein